MLVSSRSFYERQLQRYDEVLRRLDRLPAQDPCEDGEVIKFTLQLPVVEFQSDPRSLNGVHTVTHVREFTYAAIRAGGRYYTTSVDKRTADKRILSWDELVNWVLLSEGVTLVSMHKMRTSKKLTVDE